MSWFDVDRKGLAKLLEQRGKSFAIFELLQNAWDENITNVEVEIQMIPGRPAANLTVKDDSPNGFVDLSHAFTLFAESPKKTDPSLRGRFCIGEKLVLAMCEEASIASTTGTVVFRSDGARERSRHRTQEGTVFSGIIRITRNEYQKVCREVKYLIPPTKCQTFFNGEKLPSRFPVHSFRAQLPTIDADDQGNLKKTIRYTTVSLYEPNEDEEAAIYEMGLRIVDTGDRWHIDVHQKVPLTMERDNVTPAYLRIIRTMVVNEMHARLRPQDVNQPWVREATDDQRCSTEAIKAAVELRFGPRAVVFDPSDREANDLAVSKGYVVVPGNSMSKGEWENVRKAEAILPAGKVTPSPKPFGPEGSPLVLLKAENITPGIRYICRYIETVAPKLIGKNVTITLANDSSWPFGATYGDGHMYINVGRLGYRWFDHGVTEEVNSLLLHELAHDLEKNHLSGKFHQAICDLGGKLVALALSDPRLFRP